MLGIDVNDPTVWLVAMEKGTAIITLEQLLGVFSVYNPQIWPMQIVAYLLGGTGVFLAIQKTRLSGRIIPVILAFFWLWVAFIFWLPSALQGYAPGFLFTAIFLTQGVLLLIYMLKSRLFFGFQKDACSWVGILFVLYALVGYPLVGALVDHIYPRMSPFGLTPCPVVTFTFGLFLLTQRKVPKTLLVIPFFYSLSGILWISIGMWEDIGMVLSGLLGVWLILKRDSNSMPTEQPNLSTDHLDTGWSLDLPDNK